METWGGVGEAVAGGERPSGGAGYAGNEGKGREFRAALFNDIPEGTSIDKLVIRCDPPRFCNRHIGHPPWSARLFARLKGRPRFPWKITEN